MNSATSRGWHVLGNRGPVTDSKQAFLRSLPAFGALHPQALRRLAARFDDVSVPAGTVLVREGAGSPDVFLVVEGRALVSAGDDVLGTAAAGEFLGEASMLDGAPAMATVTAATPMRVLVAAGRDRGALLADSAVLRHMAVTLSRRLRARTGAG